MARHLEPEVPLPAHRLVMFRGKYSHLILRYLQVKALDAPMESMALITRQVPSKAVMTRRAPGRKSVAPDAIASGALDRSLCC